MALIWTLPDPVSGGMWLENPSRSGGVAANGQEQNIVSLAMRQRAQWTVPLRNSVEIRTARSLLARAQGKAVAINVPIFEPKKGRTATVAVNAALRATSISITMTAGPGPIEGRHFGRAGRAYLITNVSGSGPGYTLSFLPTLRDPATVGEAITFDDAFCEMNLVDDQNPIPLDVMRYAMLDLSFVESW